MRQFLSRAVTFCLPVTWTHSLNPVMSISRFCITQLCVILKVGELARWSILVSPRTPDPIIRIRFLISKASLQNFTLQLWTLQNVNAGLTHSYIVLQSHQMYRYKQVIKKPVACPLSPQSLNFESWRVHTRDSICWFVPLVMSKLSLETFS